jgi:uncharacterized repeat protein (TIGR02543 family)
MNTMFRYDGLLTTFTIFFALFAGLALLTGLVVPAPAFAASDYTWTDQTAAGSGEWFSITSSANGTKLAAVIYNGSIYTSADSGATWTEQTDAGTHNWISITSSSDGTKLAAVVSGGSIYTSADSGATWTEQTDAGTHDWYSITSSADGTKLAAVVNNGGIYTSTDSGATWTEQTDAGTETWISITSSSDGTKLAAVAQSANIFTSTDSGATWTEQTDAGTRNWYSITSSANGTKLAAVVYNGSIYTSTDSGATWTEQTDAGTRNWISITSSSDGTRLAAVETTAGGIYTSADSGATWTEQTDAGTRNWYSITSSADGTKLAAAVRSGDIWTGAQSFTLSFDTAGGSAVADMTGEISAASVTLPAAPTRSGYTFEEWNTAADGSGTSYAAGASYTMPGSDTTLYAIWEAVEEPEDSHHRSSRGGIHYGCKDKAATNYEYFSRHKQELCRYGVATSSVEQIPAIAPSMVRDLEFGMRGDDVLALQRLLNTNGSILAESGVGSPGNETNFFGALTQKALARYQSAHGVVPSVGYFGSITRAHMKGEGIADLWW